MNCGLGLGIRCLLLNKSLYKPADSYSSGFVAFAALSVIPKGESERPFSCSAKGFGL